MTTREEANRSLEERRGFRSEEDERPDDFFVAVGFPVDSEADSSSSSQEAVASFPNDDTCTMTFASVNNNAAAVARQDGRQHAEIYAVSTVVEEEKTEIIDLASTQIGTFAEATASAAVIETRECEFDGDASTRDLKREAYSGYYAIDRNENNNLPSQSASSPPHATIVSFAEHELGESALGAVHATFIGQDYAQLGTSSLREAGGDARSSISESGLDDIAGNETAEATVIDSAPFHSQDDIPEWKVNGEARVMSGESSTSTFAGCKTLANESESQTSGRSDNQVVSSSEGIVASVLESHVIATEDMTASQEAEVLGFREIHPNEFPHETTQAELVSRVSTVTDALIIDGESEYRVRVAGDDNFWDGVANSPLASGQAEVLEIQEDVHPDEFPDETEAQLVGQVAQAFVASGSNCQTESATDREMYGDAVLEFDRIHSSDGTSAHAFFHETIAVDQGQSAMLMTDGCFEAPLREATTITGHAEAIPIDDTIALTYASMPIMDPSYADEAIVLPATTGVEAVALWPEKPSGRHSINYDSDSVIQAHEAFQTPTRPTQYINHGMETPDLAASNDRSGGTSSAQRAAMQQITHSLARGTASVMGNIFGDTKPAFGGRRRSDESDNVEAVVPRTLLPWSVIPNTTTNTWTTTVQTNQSALDRNDRVSIAEANKSLRAFLLPTEKAAVDFARAWAPPRMKEKSPACHICSSRFALLRRPCHCRNCGVVICKECSVSWPSKVLPDTYNIKKESSLNICRSCDWLSSNFRLALLDGNQDRAVALHATGNINLHAPFGNIKGELLFPTHCAVIGRSLPLLKWLVDEHSCPVKSLRVSGSREAGGSYTPIVTSKGRSLLGIALENRNVDIVRYLVVEKGVSLAAEQDITFEMLLRNLDRVLHLLPEDVGSNQQDETLLDLTENSSPDPIPRHEFHDVQIRTISDEARDLGAIPQPTDIQDDCIICFDSKIDCVATPCGHQICCLQCSQQIARCPVCSSDCTFMRVFKP